MCSTLPHPVQTWRCAINPAAALKIRCHIRWVITFCRKPQAALSPSPCWCSGLTQLSNIPDAQWGWGEKNWSSCSLEQVAGSRAELGKGKGLRIGRYFFPPSLSLNHLLHPWCDSHVHRLRMTSRLMKHTLLKQPFYWWYHWILKTCSKKLCEDISSLWTHKYWPGEEGDQQAFKKKKKALTRTQSSTPNKLLYWGELSLPEDPELAYMSIFTMTTVSAGVCGFFLYETCKDSNYHVIHSLLAVSPATTVVKRAQITPR